VDDVTQSRLRSELRAAFAVGFAILLAAGAAYRVIAPVDAPVTEAATDAAAIEGTWTVRSAGSAPLRFLEGATLQVEHDEVLITLRETTRSVQIVRHGRTVEFDWNDRREKVALDPLADGRLRLRTRLGTFELARTP
jgi:hypothetical protein